MEPDQTPSPRRTDNGLYWRVVLTAVIIFLCIGSSLFCYAVLQKLDRVVVVVENLNHHVDRVVESTAPLGQAAVKTGTETLEALKTKELAKGAADATEKMEKVATDVAVDWIKSLGPSKTPATQPTTEKAP